VDDAEKNRKEEGVHEKGGIYGKQKLSVEASPPQSRTW
jgi:hypothetical protein